MTQEDEARLKIAFGHAKLVTNNRILWISPDHDMFGVVTLIKEVRSEPSLCAFLDNGRYVALYNANLKDFVVAQAL